MMKRARKLTALCAAVVFLAGCAGQDVSPSPTPTMPSPTQTLPSPTMPSPTSTQGSAAPTPTPITSPGSDELSQTTALETCYDALGSGAEGFVDAREEFFDVRYTDGWVIAITARGPVEGSDDIVDRYALCRVLGTESSHEADTYGTSTIPTDEAYIESLRDEPGAA